MPQRSLFALRLLAVSFFSGTSALALDPKDSPAEPPPSDIGGAAAIVGRGHPDAGSPGEVQGGAAGAADIATLGAPSEHDDEAEPVSISTDGSSCSLNASRGTQGADCAALLLGLGIALTMRKRR